MSANATLSRIDMSPEMAELLRAGAADGIGLCCSPGQVEKNYAVLRECERLGYLRWLNIEQPWITDAGRAAIGAPSQSEQSRLRLIELCNQRRKLEPPRRLDPRTDFDYRSYLSLGYVCTLVVKQFDRRHEPATIRVGRTLRGDPQFLGPKNAIVLPESEGRFVLAVMPPWLVRTARFPTYPLPLDESDPDFTDAERAAWDRLRNICISVNARIRSAGRNRPEKFRYGESS